MAARMRLTLVSGGRTAPDSREDPTPAPFRGRHILAVTSGGRDDLPVIRQAQFLARLTGSLLTVLAVSERRHPDAPDIHAWAGSEGIKSLGMKLSGDPCRAILDAAKERGADLIIVAAPADRWLKRLLPGHLPGRIVAGADCPVMVVHE